MFKKIFFLSFFLLLAGCGNNMNFGMAGTSQSFKQSGSSIQNALDILWVVDNSSSMTDLQAKLTTNFQSSIDMFQAKGFDFHIAVTTTDAYLSERVFENDPSLSLFRDGTDQTSHTGQFVLIPSTPNIDQVFLTNATQGVGGSGDERAFSSFRDALTNPSNTGFRRDGAFLAVIILSDEDDFSGAGRPEDSWLSTGGTPDHDYNAPTLDAESVYTNFLDQTTQSTGANRRYNVSTIAVLDSACNQSRMVISDSNIIGQRYIQLTNDTQGVTGSICDADYSKSLEAISSQIALLSTQFFLERLPVENSISVDVNNDVVPGDGTNGWTYNSASNSIQFHGSAIPPQGSIINVNFVPTETNL